MKQNETMPVSIQNKIVEAFESRMKNFYIKPPENHKGGKKYLDAQQEFFAGAVTALDTMLENTASCIPPGWYFSILRGDVIKKQNSKKLRT